MLRGGASGIDQAGRLQGYHRREGCGLAKQGSTLGQRSEGTLRSIETRQDAPNLPASRVLCTFPAVASSTRLHWTFAVTDEAPLIVNVQDLLFWPPLEQAPDQIASRPSLAVSTIDAPALKLADCVLPTSTLIPLGLDVIDTPLRPLAVTAKV